MAKTLSTSVLLLEMEDLKNHMMKVQEEVGSCVSSLAMQSEVVCEVLARLETVTAIVMAVEMVNRNKKSEKKKSFPDLDSLVDFNDNFVAAGNTESNCAFREGGQHFPLIVDQSKNHVDVNYRNEEKNSQTFKQESLKTVDTTVDCEVIGAVGEVVAAEVNQIIMNTAGDSLENILASTRPSLLRNRRKNVEAKSNKPEDFNDVIVTSLTTASNPASLASKSGLSSLVPSNSKMSSPPCSVTSGLTSSSTKMSPSSMVNRVKEICSKQGWSVEGGYSTREGKEGCGVVHFYKLEVGGGMIDLMTRGIGGSKVEAVRRAFKTMENRLIGVVMDLEEKKEIFCAADAKLWPSRTIKQLKKKDDLCDNIVNFSDEEPMSIVELKATSEDALSPPPLFHAKDCITRDSLGEREAKVLTETVKKTLLVSDYDAGAIIGTKGTTKNRISKETCVRIIVGGGSQNRVVELWGKEASVDKALEMIKEITEM